MSALKRKKAINENGCVSVSKRMAIDDLISDEIKSQKNKATLNQEILEEIFIKLINAEYSYDTTLTKVIEKFMLSGRQSFKLALNYFKKVKKVWFASEKIWIYLKKSSEKEDCRISLDSGLLKPLLNAMKSSIKEINLFLKEKSDIIFDSLIIEGIENLHISGRKLNKKQFKHLCNITSIKKLGCSLLISELPLLKSKCTKLFLRNNELKDLFKGKSKKNYLPWIKEIYISVRNIEISEIIQESFETLIDYISETFPNIKKLNLYFENHDPSWQNVYAKMKEIQPQWFDGFPPSVKGEIEFFSHDNEISYEDFCECRNLDDEYMVDLWIAAKESEIHRGFNFKFVLRD